MATWSDFDYGVTRTRQPDDVVEKLEVYPALYSGLSTISGPEIVEREDIVEDIKDNDKEYATAVGEDDDWDVGEKIHTIEVEEEFYLRTDQNEQARDNLDQLEQF